MEAARRSRGRQRPGARSRGQQRAAARSRGRQRAAARSRGRQRAAARLRHATRGDRPYAAGLVVLVALLGAMLVNPLQSYWAATDRVAALERTHAQLRTEVDRLEDERRRLHDPEELELIAREQLGLVMPGEIPFVVVEGEDELDALGPDVAGKPPPEPPWYRRLWQALGALLRSAAVPLRR